MQRMRSKAPHGPQAVRRVWLQRPAAGGQRATPRESDERAVGPAPRAVGPPHDGRHRVGHVPLTDDCSDSSSDSDTRPDSDSSSDSDTRPDSDSDRDPDSADAPDSSDEFLAQKTHPASISSVPYSVGVPSVNTGRRISTRPRRTVPASALRTFASVTAKLATNAPTTNRLRAGPRSSR